MRSLATVVLAGLAALGCSSDGAVPTQVIVLVNAEAEVRSETAEVRLLIRDGDGRDALDEVVVPSWPIKLGLAPIDGDATRTYTVTAEALDGDGAVVARARFASGYVKGEKRFVVLLLEAACLRISCSDSEDTCHEGRCVLSEVMPDQLGKVRTEPPTVGMLVPGGGVDAGAAGMGGEAGTGGEAGMASVAGTGSVAGGGGKGGKGGAGAGGRDPAGGQGGSAPPDCDAPAAPDHGSVSTESGTGQGAVASYACDTGYVLSGGAERTCQTDGSWSGSEPSCSDLDGCADTPVCTADFPCRDLPAPSLGYSCRGQYAEWTPSDSPAEFTINTDGTVSDARSQLMWQENVDSGAYTWSEASAYCDALTLAGHRDWRLPARAELESIVDFGRSLSSIDPDVFPGTPDDWFWSSSPYPWEAGNAWLVVFDNGNSFYTLTTRESRVRCVRGGVPVTASQGGGGAPPGRYAVRSNGTVDDLRTMLTWQRVASAGSYSQVDAVTHCTGLSLAGGGWRLPMISELLTIVDPTHTGPAIDPLAFPGTPAEYFWTASGHAAIAAEAWNIYFLYGYSSSTDRTMLARARCVR